MTHTIMAMPRTAWPSRLSIAAGVAALSLFALLPIGAGTLSVLASYRGNEYTAMAVSRFVVDGMSAWPWSASCICACATIGLLLGIRAMRAQVGVATIWTIAPSVVALFLVAISFLVYWRLADMLASWR